VEGTRPALIVATTESRIGRKKKADTGTKGLVGEDQALGTVEEGEGETILPALIGIATTGSRSHKKRAGTETKSLEVVTTGRDRTITMATKRMRGVVRVIMRHRRQKGPKRLHLSEYIRMGNS
jgi:hypothetical protein